jgi:hypothetical protein
MLYLASLCSHPCGFSAVESAMASVGPMP